MSPRWTAVLIATLSTIFVLLFLSFLPSVTNNVLFVAGVACFVPTFFFVFYAVDILVYREVNLIYKNVKKLKIKDFNLSRSNLIRSVNPLKKLNREISNYVKNKQLEIEELQRMEIFRREFIADVSHELKTPIFAAQGFVHTLLDGAKDDPVVSTRFLKKAAKSLDGLEALVSDLLILSQVESGDLKMHLGVVDMRQLVKEIYEDLEHRAARRGTALKIKGNGLKSFVVVADQKRIRQVLTNLIDNAIKYGREGGKVTVEFEEGKDELITYIIDDGSGIPEEHHLRIFERFYRIEKSRNKEMGGTGLGLAIVKHIINAHNSTVTVKSQLNKGTQFKFALDRLPTNEQSLINESEQLQKIT
jgi:two-component system phosphate regulon sensor histidine kinase PhoR